MDSKKIDELVSILVGLKRYEWSRVKVAVERVYSSASCRLVLDDAETIRRNLFLEFGCSNCNQQSESLMDATDNRDLDTEHECNHI